MILDHLCNAAAYHCLGQGIAKALDYLTQTDFSTVADGRYDIEGDRVFALVQSYRTRSLSVAIWEAHRQHIDVQYIVSGQERIGYINLASEPEVTEAYDADRDVTFFKPDGSESVIEMTPGYFTIFSPQDIHAPCLVTGTPATPAEVKKVVVKIAVDEGRNPCGF